MLGAGVTDLPDTIRDAVLARTARLDAPARALLDAVAIFPRRAEMWLLEAVASPAADQLEACLRTGVLRSDHDAIAFRHELARLVVEESIAPDQALALHRRALVALAEPPLGKPDLSRLAHHAEAAGDREAVLSYAPRAAAEASELGAHREAASHYGRALRHAEELAPRELADLLERRSRECYLTDGPDEAIDALRRAAACYRALGDRLKEGETLARLGMILWCPGRGEEARRTVREAVDLLEQLPPGRELALAYTSLSFVLATANDDAAAWRSAVRALELAEALADPDAICHALSEMGSRELPRDPGRGLATIERATALARKRGLVELVANSYHARATTAVQAHQDDLARIAFEEGLAYARKEGVELHELYLLAERARFELDQGRWADAVESAQLVLGRRWVSTLPRTLALTVMARTRARRGDPTVLPLLVEARALAEPTGELLRIAPVAVAIAEAAGSQAIPWPPAKRPKKRWPSRCVSAPSTTSPPSRRGANAPASRSRRTRSRQRDPTDSNSLASSRPLPLAGRNFNAPTRPHSHSRTSGPSLLSGARSSYSPISAPGQRRQWSRAASAR